MFHFCVLQILLFAVIIHFQTGPFKGYQILKSMKKFVQNPWLLALLLVGTAIVSCKKDKLETIAGFSYQVDAADYKKVTFTNASQNYDSVSWDFGDGNTSTEVSPVHIYSTTGAYTVKLSVTGEGGTDVLSQVVTISDPDAELTKLVGNVSKNWKLLRVVNANRWPLEVGPIAKDQVWWGLGRGNDDIANRPCTMNDEWIFGRDKSMQYKTNGDFWAEGGVFDPANVCAESTAANMTGPGGTDLSAFGDGLHTFVLTNGTKPTLEVVGLGAFIGLQKIGTDVEVSVPQASVKLDILKLTDGDVDTLILESAYKFGGNTSGQDDAYWKITLVHYDDPNDEPAVAAFKADVVGKTATFTNNSFEGTSYSWNFGDGATSTETSPSHTYAAGGLYTVVLNVTKGNVTTSATKQITVSGEMSEADLIGGAWKIRNAANSIFVGPGLGSLDWWQVPANFLDGTSTGADDWSCMTNDEFIFSSGGVYEYKTNGDARNDGYMGSPNGCWSDAQIAASGNGAAFGSGVHSFVFTPAAGTDRPIITLTNGASGAAFIGFYKGFYGGENSTGTNAPNGGSTTNRYEVMSYVNAGGVETLTVSVDISGAHDGSSAWTVVLTR